MKERLNIDKNETMKDFQKIKEFKENVKHLKKLYKPVITGKISLTISLQ